MLTVFFDLSSKIPLYEQLYHYIKEAIETKELVADEKLPSKRKLAVHLKISVITVETAYNQLVAEGYIRSLPKSGFYVQPLVLLQPIRTIPKSIPDKEVKTEEYSVDFRTNRVDHSHFPYNRLAKIQREVVLDQYQELINTSDYLGLRSLREQISSILFEYRGIEVSPDSIVVGSGSEHLISLLVLLLGRDKVYGVEEPGYLKNYRLYLDYGAKAKTIGLDDQGIVMNQIGNAQVLHVTPSHQFPKGIVTSISRRMELLNWVNQEEGRYIIEDDYDSEFRFSGILIPAMKRLDSLGKVIYMNSFSKSISSSFRVSFMVLPDHLMKEYQQSYSYFMCSVPILTQLTLKRFIETKEYEKHLNRMKNLYRTKRDYLIECLKTSQFGSHITIIGEESGLHFLVQVQTRHPIQRLIDQAKQEKIRVYGLYEYCLEPNTSKEDNLMVLGYSHLSLEDMKFAVSCLETAWKELF